MHVLPLVPVSWLGSTCCSIVDLVTDDNSVCITTSCNNLTGKNLLLVELSTDKHFVCVATQCNKLTRKYRTHCWIMDLSTDDQSVCVTISCNKLTGMYLLLNSRSLSSRQVCVLPLGAISWLGSTYRWIVNLRTDDQSMRVTTSCNKLTVKYLLLNRRSWSRR